MRTLLAVAVLALAFTPSLVRAQPGSKAAAAPRKHVYNMVKSGGNFESNGQGQRPGWRTVGFWSYRTPVRGDILVKRGNAGGLTIWEIEHAKADFKGSNGEVFWKGVMRDLVQTRTLTQEHIDAVTDAARTEPELLPR